MVATVDARLAGFAIGQADLLGLADVVLADQGLATRLVISGTGVTERDAVAAGIVRRRDEPIVSSSSSTRRETHSNAHNRQPEEGDAGHTPSIHKEMVPPRGGVV